MKIATQKRGNMIKKLAIVLVVLIASLSFVVGFKTPEKEMGHYYPRAFVVSQLDYARDMVIVTDAVGMEWEFAECEDWEKGDMVVAIMCDNGTENITDDYFVEIQFAGYIDPVAYWSYD